MAGVMGKPRDDVRALVQHGLNICVVGGGYVGLPTAALFAGKGARAVVYDVDRNKVEAINAGRPHIHEIGLDNLLKKAVESGRLRATTDAGDAIGGSDVMMICVGTPLKNGLLDDSYVRAAAKTIGASMKSGALVIVRSTVNPGTTENVVLRILEESSGMKLGEFGLCHAPERLQEGQALANLQNDPVVIGGHDFHRESAEAAAGVFESLGVRTEIVSSPTASETAKLVWNYTLDASIAHAQTVSLVCERFGVDFMEIRRTANMDPRIRMMICGPGAGGSCFPKDMTSLLNFSKEAGVDRNAVEHMRLVRAINSAVMPQHVVELVTECLEHKGMTLRDAKVAALGLAFKGETDDTRESPAIAVVDKIVAACERVVAYDPYVKGGVNGILLADSWQDASRNSDVCVVLTDHESFRRINLSELKKLMRNNCLVDARHVFDPAEARRMFTYRGVGRGWRE